MDTFSGVGVLAVALFIVFAALQTVHFDLSSVPHERLSMVREDVATPIPFHTLFTGMLFIQIFYWSTNQSITQKAMTAPNVREAQKGVLAAAAVRILIVPAIIVVPGVVAYQLYGHLGDQSYGRIVARVVPAWLSGGFAAMMAAAVIAHTSAILNSTVALYVVDFHDKFVRKVQDHWRQAAIVSVILTVTSIAMVPIFDSPIGIINLLQELNGLFSMPILSAFVAGLLFRNVDARAAVTGLIFGFVVYAFHNFILYKPGVIYPNVTVYQHLGWSGIGPQDHAGFHYIDEMLLVLMASVMVALGTNRVIFGNRAQFIWPRQAEAVGA